VEEARANLSSSEIEVEADAARLRAAQARVQESQANALKAARDLERMKQLIAKEEISQQQYDASVAASESLRAAVESAQAEVSGAEQTLQAARNHVERDRARIAGAQATASGARTGPQQIAVIKSRAESAAARVAMAKSALEQAALNLQYTVLRAAVGGEISKKGVEVGQLVQAGQPVFAIVTPGDLWIQASFKETQLKNIRLGQPAIISVDALGGREFKGHVDSIAAATGAKFSLLPPENATGNYVKVVQRLPVKILLEPGEDPEHLLRPGMSVVPTVLTK
jgi:membrane fusion protein (multidrug efflux system)